MKKKILTIAITVLTVVTMLAAIVASPGCSLMRLLLGDFSPYARATVKLSEMKYERPDAKETIEMMQSKIMIVDGTDGENHTLEEIENAVLDAYNAYLTWQSMETLAYVRFSIDTTDNEWVAETEFFDENTPKVNQEFENLYVACAQSENKEALENDLFGEGTLDKYVDGGILTDEIAALMQRESELVTQFSAYDYMTAEFEIDGVRGTIADHAANIIDENDYNRIYGEFYKRVNQDTGPILIELVKTRKQIAKLAGFDNYAEFAFSYALNRDYTPDQANKLVGDVKKYIVPLYNKASAEGLFDVLYDVGKIPLSAGSVNDAVENVLGKMDERLSESFKFMEKYELCYLGYDSRQLSASFTTYIPKYDAPVTVILGSGNASDALTLAHEFGHFTDGFLNYGIISNIDLSEIASTSLEYMFLNGIDRSGLSKEAIDALRKYKKASAVELYVSQCLYYAFEERLYAVPDNELTTERVCGLAREVLADFGVSDGFEFFEYSWSMIEHFYQQAFYVISYVTADSVALQIAAKEKDKAGAGLGVYFELLNWDYAGSFSDNVERVGLESPFADGAVERLADIIRNVLG